MERRPRSPTGRNAPDKSGAKSGSGSRPKSGLESGFRKREGGSSDKPRGSGKGGNFQTRDGKEGFRADDGRRPARGNTADRPKRDYGDKPQRSFDDRPKRDFADKPKRDFSDRPQRGGGDRPQRSFDDKPKRSYGDKPDRGGYSDRPQRSFEDRPKRDFGDRPARSNYEDRPKRSYDDKPKRNFGDRPKRDFSDRPQRGGGDRPQRSFDDKPKRSYGDRPQRGGYDKPNFDKPRFDKPRFEKPERAAPRGPRIDVSVYGIHAVNAALLNPVREIKAIYATENAVVELAAALEQALEEGINLPEITVVDIEALHRALPRDAVHQGVGLDTKPLEEVFIQDIIRKAEVRKKSIVVLLDQVTDPHNIGAIIRSACAFGADAIIMQSRNAPEMNGLISKTASGAAEHVPIVYETNLSRAIDQLKEAGYFALALDERGTSINDAPKYEKTLLVFGAEGPGLRPLIKEHCDLLLKLPTSGQISSLNVSNAAAVTLFAISTKV